MHGEVGQTQFLPKSILLYALDGDDDGSINLSTKADALASTANFLKDHGWIRGEGYQPGEPNFSAIQSWNAASIYQSAIAIIGKQIDEDDARPIEALSRFRRSASHRPCANLGTGRNINNPNPRRRSARRAHRSFHGSACAITTLRIRGAALAERLRLLDFCIAGLITVGCSVGVSLATWTGVGPPMDERYSSRTQPRSLVTGSDT
jgi:Transglycosylase SLT domain